MRRSIRLNSVSIALVFALAACAAPKAEPMRGTLLENLTWPEAEARLHADTIVAIPLGAASKEHGPHLLLKNDLLLAEYLKQRVLKDADVVIAPTIAYSYYPAFAEYPGSTSLRLETARDMIIDVCASLARFGPRRFYVINTGVSTRHALQAAQDELATRGIVLRWTNLEVLAPVEDQVAKQPFGSHADEIETSIMLYIAPETVDMSKAVCDCHENKGTGLSRDPNSENTFSPSGCFGDPTLATREKGRIAMENWVAVVLAEIEALRGTP